METITNLIPNITQIIIGLSISYTLLFILSIKLKDNSIADVFWGIGFSQIAIHTLILNPNKTLAHYIMTGLILIWTLRIATYIVSKKINQKGEDARYANWRKTWKHFYLRSFFQVYLLQGFLMLIISTPILILNSTQPQLPNLIITGIIIAILGLTFETIADKQIYKFIKNPKNKGKIMKTGLWKYTRHPNYFGESTFWLGITIATISISYLATISYITITFLLRYVSGVPMAEARLKENKEFIEYSKKTPPFIPNFLIK